MPETTRPDYLASAKANLDAATKTYSPEQYDGHIQAAQVQATIALAEAQETANLINYLAVAGQYRLAYNPSEAVLKSVQAQIEERLGLA